MAHNTQAILIDKNGKPIPQYFNQLADAYQPLQGEHGAARNILYGADGQPISVVDSKLAVRASEIEDALATLLTKAGFDAKADVTLSALRDALRGTGVNAKTLKDLHDKLVNLETEIQAVKSTAGIKKIIDTVVVQVAGNTMEKHGLLSNRPAANSVPDGFLYFAVDAESIDDRLCYAKGNGWKVVE